MQADGLTPETWQEKAEFWQRKCKEAEYEIGVRDKTIKEQSQRIANYLGENEQRKNPCYTVVWHGVNPKVYFAGYSLTEAQELAIKIRKTHPQMAITIQKEIEV
jgi:hypothetical protein